MTTIRLFDPVGLLSKERELKRLQAQAEALLDRMAELRQEKSYHQKPRRRKRLAR
ncbi:MAG TPA: hypothetical protein VGJ15_11795 [Pirellulales bacterium]|jgi:hypothetical protein